VRKDQPSFALGSMTLTIVGPSAKELDLLKKDWQRWLSHPAIGWRGWSRRSSAIKSCSNESDPSRMTPEQPAPGLIAGAL